MSDIYNEIYSKLNDFYSRNNQKASAIYVGYKTFESFLANTNFNIHFEISKNKLTSRPTICGLPIYKVDQDYYIGIGI